MMTLHIVAGSPNCRKVEAVIRHLGLELEIVPHDFLGGALDRPEFRHLNANGMVPVLVDGDFVLWESNAIMQYLADRSGDQGLLPRDPRARADVMRWLAWELAHFNKAFGTQALEMVAKPRLGLGPADMALVAAAERDLARFTPVLERHLAGRRYLVGDGVTIADYALATFEAYRDKVPFDWTPYRAVNAYFDRVRQLDAWVATEPAQRAAPQAA